jgi:hypothetical protein
MACGTCCGTRSHACKSASKDLAVWIADRRMVRSDGERLLEALCQPDA